MTPLRRRMLEDMQLSGLAPKTQHASIRAVRQLAEHYGKSPDQITEKELRQYFLYLYTEKHVARSTATVSLSAFKFLFEHTLRQPWPILDLIRPRLAQALPVVLSVDEVWQILGQLHVARYRVCLSTIYTCGLRVHEGAHLTIAEIDSAHAAAYSGQQRQQGSLYAAPAPHADHVARLLGHPPSTLDIRRTIEPQSYLLASLGSRSTALHIPLYSPCYTHATLNPGETYIE